MAEHLIYINMVKVFVINTGALIAWYLLLPGIIWTVLYQTGKDRFSGMKVHPRAPERKRVVSEILLSFRTCVILSVGCTSTWLLSQWEWNRIYWDLTRYSVAWHVGSLLLTVVLWDAWFYWTHRIMHHPLFFRHFHVAHHRSHNPTPWTVYSLDTSEAVTYAVFLPIVSFLYPIHPYTIGCFMVIQFACNLVLHSGYEIAPSWFAKSPASSVFSSATAHVMHHQYGKGNYGFCFQYWDHLFGTCHPGYQTRLDQMCGEKQHRETLPIEELSSTRTG